MTTRFLGTRAVMATLLVAMLASAIVAQRPRPRPATPATASDFKIRYKSTTAGQTFDSTMMIKGARQRSEMRMGHGMDMVSVTQCDLKRTIQIGDKVKKYVITPIEVNSAAPAPRNPTPATTSTEPVRRGGLVTYVTTATDTGERKEMFGFTARHIKSSLSIESSPDACNPMKHRIDMDGWYVDLAVEFDCNLGQPQTMVQPQVAAGGCRDRVEFKNVGTARKGYPLIETMTMYGPDGSVRMTTTREVVELTREPLDAALFDIPAGYSETTNAQELYSFGAMSDQSSMSQQDVAVKESTPAAAQPSKAPGTLRVGVVTISNRTDRDVSAEALRGRLVANIQGGGIDAVPLNAMSQAEAEAEARAKECDFILYTDIAALKTSTAKKIGGMFGRAAGISGVDKTEAKVEYRLFAVGETTPRLQSSASAKEEGDQVSAGVAIDQEAKAVTAEVRKRSRN